MRRASVVVPLLLIGIGALFLARNVFPELALLDYLAKYWPILLIVWGALRLLEIAFWAATARPLPVHGISGAEWVLVVFLCIFGASLHAVRGFSSWLPRSGLEWGINDMFGQPFEFPVAAETAASETPRIVIEGFRGNARITGGNVNSVKVTGRMTVRSMDQAEADRTHQEAGFAMSGDNRQVTIHSNQNFFSVTRRVTADLEITVPKGASVTAHVRDGSFDITGIGGSVDLDGDNASLRAENIGGDVRSNLRGSDIVRAVTVKGSVEIKGRGSDTDLQDIAGPVIINGNYGGSAQFHNLAKPMHISVPGGPDFFSAEKVGDMRISLGDVSASDMVGPVRLSSMRPWDVRFSNFTNSLEINLNGGDIDLRPGSLPLAKMDVHTRTGQIELALPAAAKFDLTATSNMGLITNDFGPPLTLENNFGRRGSTLRGSNGGPMVNIFTDRGQIVVRAAGVGENAPAARIEPAKPGKLALPAPITQ